MCGLTGWIWNDPERPAAPERARAMAEVLAHRGPDDHGVWSAGPAALAHRRLTIIDPSPDGRQPLSNEDGTVWVTFNGELYNFQELRADLLARGHTFRTRTDTEVLVHLYEERGARLVDDLRGMFAFAIWDTRRRRLLLARDRAGQKPLHYALDDQALRFASEPAALWATDAPPPPDPVSLHHFVHYGFVPSPRSAFSGAAKLPPAHTLEWSPGHAPVLRRYWWPSFQPRQRASIDQLDAALRDSVERRLIADVPLGAFLSGGIDSGLVVACMARARSAPPQTFTMGFAEAAYDERPLAAQVARRWSTAHHERVVPADAAHAISTLVRHYGEPFADSSAIPTYRLSQVTREHVTVALAGDAGDELFAGYLRHSANHVAALYDWVPRRARRLLRAALDAVPRRPGPRDPLAYARRFARAFDTDAAARNAAWMMPVKPLTARALYTPDFAAATAEHDPYAPYRAHWHTAPGATSNLDRALYTDFSLYLPDDLLTKVDIASMATSLEVRAPFLDTPLIELAFRLPSHQKTALGRRKRILRHLARRLLPPDVTSAPKRGFSIPLGDWLRGPLLPLFQDAVLAPDAHTAPLLATPTLRTLLDQHLARAEDWSALLWTVLCLELWHRTFYGNRFTPTPGS